MHQSAPEDLNDDKAMVAWLMQIQDAKDRAAEWMADIKHQQEAPRPAAPKAEKQ